MSVTLDFGAVLADWPLLLQGLGMTAALTAVAALAGVSLGVGCAWARVHGGALLKAVVACYVELIRNTPFIVQLFFIFFGLPGLGVKLSPEVASFLAMVVNLGAYACEIVRAGVENTPRGQVEAAVSLALSPAQVFLRVDLTVQPGEVIAIIGKSGSGKSTLLRCINGLEKFDDGALNVDGQPLLHGNAPTMRALRQRVGMIFQGFNLFPHLSVGRNVMLAPTLVKRRDTTAAAAQAAKLLERVGLGEKFDAHPDQLSGGQQQRVAIARALAMEPAVLLCDEIISALDLELVGEVLRVVASLAEEGMTLPMVTHEMSFARKVCDRLVFMHAGRIHEVGPPEQLFGQPQTAELKQFLSALHG